MTRRMDWDELRGDPMVACGLAAEGESVVVLRDGRPVITLGPGSAERVPWVVAVTGASGVRYAARVIRGLLDAGEAVDLVVSRAGRLTILDETGAPFRDSHWREDLARWLAGAGGPVDLSAADVRHWSPGDFAAGPASGSYRTRGMVVVPATSAAVAGIALGISKDLVQRAAEVTLKERRRLVIVLRETPLTRATLRHLLALDEMGAVVLPAAPGFYAGAESVDALVDFIAGKVLDVLDVPHACSARWRGRLGEAIERAAPPVPERVDGMT